jgi:chromosome partitioning protein
LGKFNSNRTGKTSLSCSIAVELAQKGRTILLDLDPQGNSSSWMLSSTPKYELASVLFGKTEVENAIVPTPVSNLDILPTFGIDGELKLYGENQLANEPFIFCDLIESLTTLGYDYAVFDLSPGMGRLERSALIAADEVVTPMTPEAFSLDGIEIFSAELEKTKKAMRRGPIHTYIIVNAFDTRIKQHVTIMEKAKELKGYKLFTIGVDPAFRKAQAANIPIQFLPKKEAAKAETLGTLHEIGDALCL